jgi:hypothetical protein
MSTYIVGDNFFLCDHNSHYSTPKLKEHVASQFGVFTDVTRPINVWPYSFMTRTQLNYLHIDDRDSSVSGDLKLYPTVYNEQHYLNLEEFIEVNCLPELPDLKRPLGLVFPNQSVDASDSYLLLFGTMEQNIHLFTRFQSHVPGWSEAVFGTIFPRALRTRFSKVRIINKDKIALQVMDLAESQRPLALYDTYLEKCKKEGIEKRLSYDLFRALVCNSRLTSDDI